MSRKKGRDLHGVVVIDKPAGVTSAQVVTAVRRRLGCSRVGHTGTLDPMATGVLPLCIGEATKLASYLLADDKAYEAELELGIETDTLDLEGEILVRAPEAAAAITEADVRAVLPRFTGAIEQIPPMYSAIKRDGRRLHQLAREGVEVEREPRPVVIYRLELLAFTPPRVRLAVACSKGTYVRSLVADIGRALGAGATLTGLRRTQSGVFSLASAVILEQLERSAIVSLVDLLPLPAFVVTDDLHRSVLDGRLLRLDDCKPRSESQPSVPPMRFPLPPSQPPTDGNDAHETRRCMTPVECARRTPLSEADRHHASETAASVAPEQAAGPEGSTAAVDASDVPDAHPRADDASDAPSMQLLTERGELLALARVTPAATVRLLRVFTYGLTVAVPSANLSRSNNP